MSSPATVNLKNPGNAMIIGHCVVENARRDTTGGLTYSKLFVLDGQFWINDDVQLVAYFRFWNSANVVFPEVGKYMLCANVTKVGKGAVLFSGSLDHSEYHMVGDVQWLVPIPEDTNMCVEPWVIASGTVTDVNDQRATFGLITQQYTTAFKSQERIPLRAMIPESPRYKGKKPMPKDGGFAQVSGWMKSVSWGDAVSDRTEPPVAFFHIEIVDIAFFPASVDIPSNKSAANSPAKTPSKKRGLKFGYDISPTKKQKVSETHFVAPELGQTTHVGTSGSDDADVPSSETLTIRIPASQESALSPSPAPSGSRTRRSAAK
ncbi:hypothetical protein PQX77_011893 [Marasmius sp. AFHP31]|nr:hypothetical protein PQX77_011893 [Marasmius sp. AFHP31]